MLSNFQLGEQALLQCFLIGQPELRDMMHGPQMQQLRQRVIASYHLGPMDKAETQAYIEHRLVHVGWKGDPRFEPAAFELIYTLSGGIPRRINTICNRLLLAGYPAGEARVRRRRRAGDRPRDPRGARSRTRRSRPSPWPGRVKRQPHHAAMLQDAGAVLAQLREIGRTDRPAREDRRFRRRSVAPVASPRSQFRSRARPRADDEHVVRYRRDRSSASSAHGPTT